MQEPIYLDYNATTPLDPRVREVTVEAMVSLFGNSSSSTHAYGWKAQKMLKRARKHVADLLGASDKFIYFNSGATEANNTILRAVFEAFKPAGCHIITSSIEHKCILRCCEFLKSRGCEISYLPVDSGGRIRVGMIPAMIQANTRLISVMGANNETGVIQDLESVCRIAQEKKILCHSDVAQYVGKVPFSVKKLPFDFLSLSGHKFYGPKGVGAIYSPHAGFLKKFPLIFGGGQERSTRAGTVNTPGVAGFGEAARLATLELEAEAGRLQAIKEEAATLLKREIPSVVFNGRPAATLPGTLNFYIPGLASKDLLSWTKEDVALGTGSACTSVTQDPSHVLTAMGLGRDECQSSLRLSFGRFTEADEVRCAIEILISGVSALSGCNEEKAV